MKRILGIDYGDKRIGFALSDPMRIIASPMEVYSRVNLEKDLEYINQLVAKNDVGLIVMGLPINMDGTEGERAQLAREFGGVVAQKTGLKIEYVDERWTSKESERMLIMHNVRREKRKGIIDKIAAQNILQRFLDSSRNQRV